MQKPETTSVDVALKALPAGWIIYKSPPYILESNRIYIATDGSSLGGFAAIIVYPDKTVKLSGFKPQTPSRNIAAEFNSVLLGIESLEPSDLPVTIVHDLIHISAFGTKSWIIKNEEVKEITTKIREVLKKNPRKISFLQVKGHQKDDNVFSKLNEEVDALCTEENIKNGVQKRK